jgi:hypothetical protein
MDTATIKKREEIARLILSTEDKEVIEQLFNYAHALLCRTDASRQESWDEVVESVEWQLSACEKGELETVSHSEVLNRVKEWK